MDKKSKVFSIEASVQPSVSFRNTSSDHIQLKQSSNQLTALPNKRNDQMEVGIGLVQDACELQRPLD